MYNKIFELYIACFERDDAYRKNFDDFKLKRVFRSWRRIRAPLRASDVSDKEEENEAEDDNDEEEVAQSEESEEQEKQDLDKLGSVRDDFEDTEIPEYEELDRELNGMADMFRKIFLGGKVFSAVRILNRKKKMKLNN